MPVGAGGGPGGPGGSGRQTFRPPWVKDGPQPIPMPTQPWVKSSRAAPGSDKQEATSIVSKALRKMSDGGAAAEEPASTAPVRKTSKITIVPAQPKENGLQRTSKSPDPKSKAAEPAKVAEKPPKPTDAARKVSEPAPAKPKQPEASRKVSEPAQKPAERVTPTESKRDTLERQSSRPRMLERSKTSEKYEGLTAAKPPPPPMPPAPPPPPPPPPMHKDLLPGTHPPRGCHGPGAGHEHGPSGPSGQIPIPFL